MWRSGGAQQVHRLLANPARWHVDDALMRDPVGITAQDAQPGERILHLAALIEARATDELVRN